MKSKTIIWICIFILLVSFVSAETHQTKPKEGKDYINSYVTFIEHTDTVEWKINYSNICSWYGIGGLSLGNGDYPSILVGIDYIGWHTKKYNNGWLNKNYTIPKDIIVTGERHGTKNCDYNDLNQEGKVDICHFPHGNPQNCKQISVNESSLQDHLNHGDYIGKCEEDCMSKYGCCENTEKFDIKIDKDYVCDCENPDTFSWAIYVEGEPINQGGSANVGVFPEGWQGVWSAGTSVYHQEQINCSLSCPINLLNNETNNDKDNETNITQNPSSGGGGRGFSYSTDSSNTQQIQKISKGELYSVWFDSQEPFIDVKLGLRYIDLLLFALGVAFTAGLGYVFVPKNAMKSKKQMAYWALGIVGIYAVFTLFIHFRQLFPLLLGIASGSILAYSFVPDYAKVRKNKYAQITLGIFVVLGLFLWVVGLL